MWIDTSYDDVPAMFNSSSFSKIYIEFHRNCWEILAGNDGNDELLGIFDNFDEAHAEYDKICAAIKSGANYYKVGSD